MSQSAIIRLRIDEETKKEAEILFNSIGLTLSQAIKVFLTRSIAEQGFPFEVKAISQNLDTSQ